MDLHLQLDISKQPDDTTCGPTCLHSVYGYYGDSISLEDVIREVRTLDGGGTLGVLLACHALQRGYRATVYSYNLQIFDPTWFRMSTGQICERLAAQLRAKPSERMEIATQAYLEFFELGGRIRFEDLSEELLRRNLDSGVPILTGLSATYLYQSAREVAATNDFDDIRGEPMGHFVVVCGYHAKPREVLVADPLHPNPLAPTNSYKVGVDRLVGAIMLGIVTYDANLVIIEAAGDEAR